MKKSQAKFDGPPDKREAARKVNKPEAPRLSQEQRSRDPKGKKKDGGGDKPKA